MMDVNTKLRNDKFLFPDELENDSKKSNATGIMVAALNKRGIETVNDLIHYDQTKFNSLNAHYLSALIQILKYKYLGEELVSDVIFEYKYSRSSKDKKKLARDLRRLGFGRGIEELEARAQRFMDETPEFTMEDVLKSDNRYMRTMKLFGNADFRGFYLEYINEKRKKEMQERTLPPQDVMSALKQQLESLVLLRADLDKQIESITKQINAIDGGHQKNGK